MIAINGKDHFFFFSGFPLDFEVFFGSFSSTFLPDAKRKHVSAREKKFTLMTCLKIMVKLFLGPYWIARGQEGSDLHFQHHPEQEGLLQRHHRAGGRGHEAPHAACILLLGQSQKVTKKVFFFMARNSNIFSFHSFWRYELKLQDAFFLFFQV